MSFPTAEDLANGITLTIEEDNWKIVTDGLTHGHSPRFVGTCEGVNYIAIVDRICEHPKIHLKIIEVEGRPV